MPDYPFDEFSIVSATNPDQMAAENDQVLIHALGDATRTPLEIRDLGTGQIIGNPIYSNRIARCPGFIADIPTVVAYAATPGVEVKLESTKGIRDDAATAAAAAVAVEAKANNGEFKGDKGDTGDPGPQGLPGTNAVPADTAVAGYIQTAGTSATKTALNNAIVAGTAELAQTHEPPLSKIAKARTGKYRVMLAGTSIANNSSSGVKAFLSHLKSVYGDTGTVEQVGGILGGGFETIYQGWAKQIYGGPSFVRARANSTSTPIVRQGYFDTVTVEYSVEADAAPVEILIDGVSQGSIGGPGTQAYSQKATFTTTLGAHTLTIGVPATGHFYLERFFLSNSASKGVEYIDGTLGGSAVSHIKELKIPTGAQTAGIPINGLSGAAGFFSRADVDHIIVHYLVNDAGMPHGNLETHYKPVIEYAVEKAAENGQTLTFVVEMGGHYALPGSPNHAFFETLRAYLLSLRTHPHVTVIDWHAATTMDDGVAYAARYYNATAVNPDTGAYTGDFIHPKTAGYQVLIAQLATVYGVPIPQEVTEATLNQERARSLPVGLGDDKVAVVDGATVHFPVPIGPANVALGYAPGSYVSSKRGVYRKLDALDTRTESIKAEIAASPLSDEYGKYINATNKVIGLSSFVDWAGGVRCYLTVKAAGTVEFRAESTSNLYTDGVLIPRTDTVNNRTTIQYAAGNAPGFYAVQVGAPANSGQTVLVSGKIYDIALTNSDVPILT